MRNRPPTDVETMDFQPGDVVHQIRSSGKVEAFWMLQEGMARKYSIDGDGQIKKYMRGFDPEHQERLERMMAEVYSLRDRYLVEGLRDGVGEEVDRIMALHGFNSELVDEEREVFKGDLLSVVTEGDLLAENFPEERVRACGKRWLDPTSPRDTVEDNLVELNKIMVKHVGEAFPPYMACSVPIEDQLKDSPLEDQVELKKLLLFISELGINSRYPSFIAADLSNLGMNDDLARYAKRFVYGDLVDYYPPPSIREAFSPEETRICAAHHLELSDGDCSAEGFSTALSGSVFKGLVENRLAGIVDVVRDYGRGLGLTKRALRHEIRPDMINAAGELSRQYDLIVGVMNSGGIMGSLCELMGGNVRYLDWHRHWKKKGPTWRKIGADPTRVKEAKKILVCDNDADTGGTMRRIATALEALNPEAVDVCFFLDAEKNAVVDEIPFYRRRFGTWNVQSQNFFEHLQHLEAVLVGPHRAEVA